MRRQMSPGLAYNVALSQVFHLDSSSSSGNDEPLLSESCRVDVEGRDHVIEADRHGSTGSAAWAAAAAAAAATEAAEAAKVPAAPGYPLSRATALGASLLITLTMSGGLIYGCGPFQDALVRQFGYTDAEAARIFGAGMQMLIVGTAILSPALTKLGPRWLATSGLLAASLGHWYISRIQFGDVGVRMLMLGYGLVGLGGNLAFVAALYVADLFENASLVSSIICGAYQTCGFVFMALTQVPFVSFFRVYMVTTLLGALVAFLIFPDAVGETDPDGPRWGLRLGSCPWRRRRHARLGENRASRLQRSIRGYFCSLAELRTWLFMMTFAWGGTCASWGLGAFVGAVKAKPGAAQAEATVTALIALQPVIANSTFLFSPLVGTLCEGGFATPAMAIGVVSCIFSGMFWLLPLHLQWLSLCALCVLQALVYCVQVAYIATTYEPRQLGKLMSLSTVAQGLVNPLGVALLNFDVGTAAVIFAVPALPLSLGWGFVERCRAHQSSQRRPDGAG